MDYNAEFTQKLNQLNDAQREAVEHINGPLIVVAGPGTGKTQLLAMRAANILRQTDVLPSNILCLTFTEAAATNMVDRLSTIIGSVAYQLDINTFHGFGASIMNRFSEYFYDGADYRPASELTQGEVINNILTNLPFDHRLRSMRSGQFVYRKDIQSFIKDLKRAAITPGELRQIANQNLQFCDQLSQEINDAFSARMTKGVLPTMQQLVYTAQQIATKQPTLEFTNEPKLGDLFAINLQSALDQILPGETKVTPVSNFKKVWTDNINVDGKVMRGLKDQRYSQDMLLLADIYEAYLNAMDERGLYDFDDMIMNVIQTIEQNPELKANLQEQYQYIMVDEFQDTNDAQMRLLSELTDYDDQPNLMVVGDDDQAIYRFQGADISNIQLFAKRFPTLHQINLKNNYRSSPDILTVSQAVSGGITSRLTNVDGSPKQLVAICQSPANLRMVTALTSAQEMDYVARQIQQLIQDGHRASDIAVIGCKHCSLEPLVPHLAQRGIGVSYERQRNIFNSPLIQLIIDLATLIQGMSDGNINAINQSLPRVLASEAFGLSRADYYHLCLTCHGQGTEWLEQLAASPKTQPLVNWLQELARHASDWSLNRMLLSLIGTTTVELSDNNDEQPLATANDNGGYRSPIFDYYLNYRNLQRNTLTYLELLNDVTTLVKSVREYLPEQEPHLSDLLDFVKQSQSLDISINSRTALGDNDSVQLMSAHSSKGLEFQTVFIIDASSNLWGSKRKNKVSYLHFPANMPYNFASTSSDDERRRLLYVAMTRAKQNLIITTHSLDDSGKALVPLEYLLDFPSQQTLPEPGAIDSITQLETSLMDRLVEPFADQRSLLATRLDNYRLSATDLATFTDIENGGPQHFLLYNLLRIPTATSGALVFGNAVHFTMQKLHNIVQMGGTLPSISQALEIFHKQFDTYAWDIDADEARTYRNKGDHALTVYLTERGDSFSKKQLAEQKLQAVIDGDIRITGKIDCMEVNQQDRTICITDYKTGKGIEDFRGKGSDYARIKAHRYAEQLMFYKLLIENSPQYADYRVISGTLDFVEPDQFGNLYQPTMDLTDRAMMDDFVGLVRSVWNHILSLDLPDISPYPQKFSGVIDFEDWLRNHPATNI